MEVYDNLTLVSDCLVFNFSKSNAYIENTTSTTTEFVGVASCLAAMIVIFVSKAYKEFIHRLILYLSVLAMLLFLSEWLAWNYREVTFKFLQGYFALAYALVVCWIGVYILMLVVCSVKPRKLYHEYAGIVVVLCLPILIVWTVFVYYNSSTECVLTFKYALVLLCGIALFGSFCILVSMVTVTYVVISLCRACTYHRGITAIRTVLYELVTLQVFVLLHCVLAIAYLCYYVHLMLADIGYFKPSLIFVIVFDFHPFATLSLPLVLLCQTRIRQRLTMCTYYYYYTCCVGPGIVCIRRYNLNPQSEQSTGQEYERNSNYHNGESDIDDHHDSLNIHAPGPDSLADGIDEQKSLLAGDTPKQYI